MGFDLCFFWWCTRPPASLTKFITTVGDYFRENTGRYFPWLILPLEGINLHYGCIYLILLSLQKKNVLEQKNLPSSEHFFLHDVLLHPKEFKNAIKNKKMSTFFLWCVMPHINGQKNEKCHLPSHFFGNLMKNPFCCFMTASLHCHFH